MTFAPGDLIMTETDHTKDVTLGKHYVVTEYHRHHDPARCVVYFEDNRGATRRRWAHKYQFVSASSSSMDAGVEEYELTMKGQELWASIRTNSEN